MIPDYQTFPDGLEPLQYNESTVQYDKKRHQEFSIIRTVARLFFCILNPGFLWCGGFVH